MTSPAPSTAAPRAPFGPSVMSTGGMPADSTGCVDQASRPAVSRALSSSASPATSAAMSLPMGGTVPERAAWHHPGAMTRRVLICGAGGGLGPVVARRLAAEGAALVAADLRREPLDALAGELGLPAERWRADVVDMLDEAAVRAWAADVGAVDAVLHLVGGWRGGAGVEESDLADYAWLHDGLVRTLQHVSRAFLPALKASGRGRLAIVSSPQAERPSATQRRLRRHQGRLGGVDAGRRRRAGRRTAARPTWCASTRSSRRGCGRRIRTGTSPSFTPAEAIADAFVFLLGDGGREDERAAARAASLMRAFASDNYAGVHPDVLAAIAEANAGHAVSYGDDPWTEALRARVRDELGPDAELHLVFNGTAANVLAVSALTQPWEAVICAASSHLNVDECGAPERAGRKLLAVPAPDGRLAPAALEGLLVRIGDPHVIQPRVVSVTQSTELGTRYPLAAVRELADWAHGHGLLLHVDGARLFNAAAGLGLPLGELTTAAGVDALSLGGDQERRHGRGGRRLPASGLAPGFPFLRKQGMQLASKMRFMAAQLLALFEGELWRANAAHANAMAQRLADGGARRARPARDPAGGGERRVRRAAGRGRGAGLAREWPFYVWDEHTGEVRWMCAWDTRAEDVDAFAAADPRRPARGPPPPAA